MRSSPDPSCNVSCLLTIACKHAGPGPPEVLLAAAEDIHKTQKCKSRLCMRFTPVETVCYAAVNEMKRAAEKVVLPYFSDTEQPKKFAVQYDHRASAKLDRLAVINAVIEGVKQVLTHQSSLSVPHLRASVTAVRGNFLIRSQLKSVVCCAAATQGGSERSRLDSRRSGHEERLCNWGGTAIPGVCQVQLKGVVRSSRG